ncbi:MAG: nucleotidyl transferase AbiEii/AbiGii toxin family protein [Oceanipulchritudo sp.]
MPLTPIQKEVLVLLADNRSPDSHLAGATGIRMAPETPRHSHDLDLFHASEEAVARAYARDVNYLQEKGFASELLLSQPGFIRARVGKNEQSLLIDWAQDSIWRFFPPVQLESVGWVLHPVDLAVNKVLALAGRDEPRDFVDTLYLHESVLPLGALAWAAAGKDPGLNPQMLLELLQRKGRISREELRRLDLRVPLDPEDLHNRWETALRSAREWVAQRPGSEAGCLYTHPDTGLVFAPQPGESSELLRGKAGGVLPRVRDVPLRSFAESPDIRKWLEGFFQRPLREG